MSFFPVWIVLLVPVSIPVFIHLFKRRITLKPSLGAGAWAGPESGCGFRMLAGPGRPAGWVSPFRIGRVTIANTGLQLKDETGKVIVAPPHHAIRMVEIRAFTWWTSFYRSPYIVIQYEADDRLHEMHLILTEHAESNGERTRATAQWVERLERARSAGVPETIYNQQKQGAAHLQPPPLKQPGSAASDGSESIKLIESEGDAPIYVQPDCLMATARYLSSFDAWSESAMARGRLTLTKTSLVFEPKHLTAHFMEEVGKSRLEIPLREIVDVNAKRYGAANSPFSHDCYMQIRFRVGNDIADVCLTPTLGTFVSASTHRKLLSEWLQTLQTAIIHGKLEVAGLVEFARSREKRQETIQPGVVWKNLAVVLTLAVALAMTLPATRTARQTPPVLHGEVDQAPVTVTKPIDVPAAPRIQPVSFAQNSVPNQPRSKDQNTVRTTDASSVKAPTVQTPTPPRAPQMDGSTGPGKTFKPDAIVTASAPLSVWPTSNRPIAVAFEVTSESGNKFGPLSELIRDSLVQAVKLKYPSDDLDDTALPSAKDFCSVLKLENEASGDTLISRTTIGTREIERCHELIVEHEGQARGMLIGKIFFGALAILGGCSILVRLGTGQRQLAEKAMV